MQARGNETEFLNGGSQLPAETGLLSRRSCVHVQDELGQASGMGSSLHGEHPRMLAIRGHGARCWGLVA